MLQTVRCAYEARKRSGSGMGYSLMERPVILRAETLLRSIAVVRMTKEEAQELVGESNVTEENETPYLLRAVGDTKEVFPLELDVRPDGTVWVGGGANSKCPVAMRRRPVVV